MVQRVCFKVFWSCTQYALPPLSAGIDVNLWFRVMAHLLEKRLPEASEGVEPAGQPTSVDDRNAWPWWKMKKWAIRIVAHFIQRYGNPRYAGAENQKFAEHFRAHYAAQLLSPVLSIISTKSNGGFVTDIVYRTALAYVCSAVEMSPTYKIIKPHLQSLLFAVILPTLCLQAEDIEYVTWQYCVIIVVILN